jgi:hypothetical protein
MTVLLILAAPLSTVPVAAATDQRLSPPPLLTTSLSASYPKLATFASQSVVEITYTSHLNVSSTFIVYGVFHNSAGQVVYMTTASLTISVGGNQTAYLITSLLSHGSYRATLFAISTGGVVVSPSSSISVQVT